MSEPSALAGTTLAERYKVVREIGSGSMGAVYEARHTVLGRRLAIKVLRQDCSSPQLKERFFNEARAAGAINHQHIVQVYDYGLVPASGEPYIVMEFVSGETLDQYMREHMPLPEDEAVEICIQILSALEAIHGKGLVHRDIKPGNVMLVKALRPRLFLKLVDFGIAKAVKGQWDWPTLTRVDEVLGTPVYLSPEQAMGGKADPRWDLWAVGLILYEMLAGDLPFPTKSLVQITEDILHHRFVPLHEKRGNVSPWLLEIQQKALDRQIDRRFGSATEYMRALDRKSVSPLIRKGGTVPDILASDAEDTDVMSEPLAPTMEAPAMPEAAVGPAAAATPVEATAGATSADEPVFLLRPGTGPRAAGGPGEEQVHQATRPLHLVRSGGPASDSVPGLDPARAGSLDPAATTLQDMPAPLAILPTDPALPPRPEQATGQVQKPVPPRAPGQQRAPAVPRAARAGSRGAPAALVLTLTVLILAGVVVVLVLLLR